MGAADFNTGATIKGTAEEVFAILKVIRSYVTDKREQHSKKRNCPYLMSACINGENEFGHQHIDQLSDDELKRFIEEKNCVVVVDASGPYGVFGLLDEVDLFHDMAEAAPTANFEGGMGGFGTGGDQAASFELKDGLLYCKYSYPSDDVWEEEDEFDEDWEGDGYTDDDDDDWDDEPNWDEEVIYDPVKKKNVN